MNICSSNIYFIMIFIRLGTEVRRCWGAPRHASAVGFSAGRCQHTGSTACPAGTGHRRAPLPPTGVPHLALAGRERAQQSTTSKLLPLGIGSMRGPSAPRRSPLWSCSNQGDGFPGGRQVISVFHVCVKGHCPLV